MKAEFIKHVSPHYASVDFATSRPVSKSLCSSPILYSIRLIASLPNRTRLTSSLFSPLMASTDSKITLAPFAGSPTCVPLSAISFSPFIVA